MSISEFYGLLIMCFVGILLLLWSGYYSAKGHNGRTYVLFVVGMLIFLSSISEMLPVEIEKVNDFVACVLISAGGIICVLISAQGQRLFNKKKD